MPALELRILPRSGLAPGPNHPRRALKPGSPAYRKLKAGIAAFGLVEPLVWNELTGHVVDGAARLGVLADLDVAEVPVSVVRLSMVGETALGALLNNTKAQGRFDPPKLAVALSRLDTDELALTGFDRRAARTLRLVPQGGAPPEPRADRVEVTLVTDAATFAALSPGLNALIGDHELVAHVRRGA